jgi:hypothetical protein
MNIKSSTAIAAVFLTILAFGAVAASAGGSSVSTPVTNLKFGPTGVTDGVHRELYAAAAYGDHAHGAHGTFIKMHAGFVSNVHTHTEDYWGVVISGVGVNEKPGAPDVALPVGSYWFQKGGERHVTKCISANECIFFINQSGKFDYLSEAQK